MADEQAFKVVEVVVPGPQGAGNTFALTPSLTPIAMSERLPKLRWDIKEFPRLGRSARDWVAAAAAALITFAAGAPATLALGEQTLDLGATAIVLNVNGGALTIDVNGTTLSHSGAKLIEFQNAKGGGIAGKCTITGPHTSQNYQIRTVDCTGMSFEDFNLDHGNSGIEFYRSKYCRLKRVNFTNMWAVAVKSTEGSIGNFVEDCIGTNLAGFFAYGDRWANGCTVLRCRKRVDFSILTTYLTGQLEYATTEAGSITTSPFLGEEGGGLTVDTEFWLFKDCVFEDVGDNGISFTGRYHRAIGCTFIRCKHDGGHAYGSFNTFTDCQAFECGKYSVEIDPETGKVISTAQNGYGFSARPNAGGCARGNVFTGCLSLFNRKGDFHCGDALLYRPWISGLADVPDTDPDPDVSNAVDNVKDYCYVTINGWTTVWTGGGPATGPITTSGPTPTQFGTVSATAYGILIDATTGAPTNTPHVATGFVWWNDGRTWWYWRSSCPAGRGPWATDTQFRGCRGNHPTRSFWQDASVPADANNSFDAPAVLSVAAFTHSDEAVLASAPDGTLTLTPQSLVKLNAATDSPQTVSTIVTPLGFKYHRVLLRNGNSQPWTFVHDSTKIRLFGGANVTLGYNDTIEFVQIAVSGAQIWLQVSGSVRAAPTALGAGWTAGTGACVLTDAGNGTIQHTAIGSTATPDFNQRVARGTPEAPANVNTGTIVQKWVGGAYWNGSWVLIGRVYSVVSAFDQLGEPRVSYRWNFQPYAHASGGGANDNNDYIGFVLDHDGNMGLGTPGQIITYPKAHAEFTEDVAADMFALRSELALDATGIVANAITIGEIGLVKITTAAPASISQVNSVSECRPEVLIYNGGTQALTFVHDSTKLRLHGGQNFVLKANDYIRLQRLTSSSPHVWLQVGGYSTP